APRRRPVARRGRGAGRGRGAHEFSVKVERGEYRLLILHPDRTVDERKLTAAGGRLAISLPSGQWSVSGIVVKGSKPAPVYPSPIAPAPAARPVVRHAPPSTALAGAPLSLSSA